MTISFEPISLPRTADAKHFVDFGRVVKGVHPGILTPEEFKEVEQALYKASLWFHVNRALADDLTATSTTSWYSAVLI